MAAIADILTSTLIDYAQGKTSDAATGVDTTWEPARIDPNGVAKWEDRSGGVQSAFPTLTMSLRPPTKTSKINKVTVKLLLPIQEEASGANPAGYTPAPAVAYTLSFVGEFMLPERSTNAERVDFLSHIASLFNTNIQASDGSPTDATGSPLKALVEDLESVY